MIQSRRSYLNQMAQQEKEAEMKTLMVSMVLFLMVSLSGCLGDLSRGVPGDKDATGDGSSDVTFVCDEQARVKVEASAPVSTLLLLQTDSRSAMGGRRCEEDDSIPFTGEVIRICTADQLHLVRLDFCGEEAEVNWVTVTPPGSLEIWTTASRGWQKSPEEPIVVPGDGVVLIRAAPQ